MGRRFFYGAPGMARSAVTGAFPVHVVVAGWLGGESPLSPPGLAHEVSIVGRVEQIPVMAKVRVNLDPANGRADCANL